MQLDDKAKHKLINREALFTLLAAVCVMIFWWLGGFGLYTLYPNLTIYFMPAWFVIGSFGSWFFAIALSIFLTKKIFSQDILQDT